MVIKSLRLFGHRLWIAIGWTFEPRNIWIGFQWKRWPQAIELTIGPVPMIQIIIYIQWFD